MRLKIIFVTISLVFLAVTNHWEGWSEGIRLFSATDVHTYETIALASPFLPSNTRLQSHLAERFPIHYVLGFIAGSMALPLHAVYWASLGLLVIAELLVLECILGALGLSSLSWTTVVAVFVMNPYCLRFYTVVPGMLADHVFMLAQALLLLGLVVQRVPLVLLGAALAGGSRQTSVLLLPGMALWLWRGKGWAKRSFRSRALVLAMGCGAIGAELLLLRHTAALFSIPTNFSRVMIWSTHESAFGIAEHVLRVFLPMAVVLAILGVCRLKCERGFWTWELAASLLMGIGGMSQPLLFNPETVLHNEGRLAALSLFSMVVALGYALRALEARLGASFSIPCSPMKAMLFALLAASSFHHISSSLGPSNAVQFAGMEVILACLIALCFSFSTRVSA